MHLTPSKMWMRLLALGVFVCLPNVALAQSPDSSKSPAASNAAGREIKLPANARGRLLGVYSASTGDPIEGVEVWDLIANAFTTTSSTGTVSLGFARSQHDSSVIWLRKIGFQDSTLLVLTGPADTIPITFMMERVDELAPIVTTAEGGKHTPLVLRAFEARQLQGQGKFLTPADMRKEPDGRQMGELLASKGIDLTRRTQKTLMTTCRTQVYLDGVRSTFDPRSSVSDYEAVEFYAGPATVPQEYRSNAACGVLLLWTRVR
ncbi:MAG: hypothetical protein ABJE47_11235 [bacterium]